MIKIILNISAILFSINLSLAQKEHLYGYGDSSPLPESNNWEYLELSGKVQSVTETMFFEKKEKEGEISRTKAEIIKYIFNSKGYKINEIHFTADSTLIDSIVYNYNAFNNLISTINYSSKNSISYHYTYIYNSKNQLISEINKTNSHKNTFQYNDLGQLIQIIKINSKNDSLGKQNFEYDSLGNLICLISYNHINNLSSSINRRFDSSGKVMESLYKGEIINCAGRNQWDYIYNSKGHIEEQKSTGIAISYKRDYDPNGNWVKQIESSGSSTSVIKERQIQYFD